MGTGQNEHFTSVLTMELCTYIYEDGQGTMLGKAHSSHVYSTCLAKATRMETGSNRGEHWRHCYGRSWVHCVSEQHTFFTGGLLSNMMHYRHHKTIKHAAQFVISSSSRKWFYSFNKQTSLNAKS